MTEIHSLETASKISADYQDLIGKVFKNHTVKTVGIVPVRNQPLYTVEVTLIQDSSKDIIWSTIEKFCYDNLVSYDKSKYYP